MEQRIIKYLIIFLSIVIIINLIGFFYLFILPNFVFYCPSADEDVPIPVGCLIRFPEDYNDKYIKVVGMYKNGQGIWTISSENSEYNISINGLIYGPSAYFPDDARAYLHFSMTNISNGSMLIENNEYYWYGIFRYTDSGKTSGGEYFVKGMYLEVSKIEEL
ncbi:MAG: hypothetical protein JSW06_06010 [Thermoplasmatales archaeon]|nr:MAG: hypothetical protein JSW06_06010 [Thermoplasmatales archaeon]